MAENIIQTRKDMKKQQSKKTTKNSNQNGNGDSDAELENKATDREDSVNLDSISTKQQKEMNINEDEMNKQDSLIVDLQTMDKRGCWWFLDEIHMGLLYILRCALCRRYSLCNCYRIKKLLCYTCCLKTKSLKSNLQNNVNMSTIGSGASSTTQNSDITMEMTDMSRDSSMFGDSVGNDDDSSDVIGRLDSFGTGGLMSSPSHGSIRSVGSKLSDSGVNNNLTVQSPSLGATRVHHEAGRSLSVSAYESQTRDDSVNGKEAAIAERIANIDMRHVQSSTAGTSATATDVVYNDDEWMNVLAVNAADNNKNFEE